MKKNKKDEPKKEKKPLVNWFKRDKEIEFSNVKNSKGEDVIDKKTKKPLTKVTKRVTAPESVLSRGFTKEVTKEQKIDRKPAKKVKVKLPIPIVAPFIAGTIASAALSNKIGGNDRGSKGMGRSALAGLPMAAGMVGSIAMAKNASESGKDRLLIKEKDKDSGLKRGLKVAANIATGFPAGYQVGSYTKKAKTGVKTTTTRTKVKNPRESGGGNKKTPRFM